MRHLCYDVHKKVFDVAFKKMYSCLQINQNPSMNPSKKLKMSTEQTQLKCPRKFAGTIHFVRGTYSQWKTHSVRTEKYSRKWRHVDGKVMSVCSQFVQWWNPECHLSRSRLHALLKNIDAREIGEELYLFKKLDATLNCDEEYKSGLSGDDELDTTDAEDFISDKKEVSHSLTHMLPGMSENLDDDGAGLIEISQHLWRSLPTTEIFSGVPIHQIICNLGTKGTNYVQKCTSIGKRMAENLIRVAATSMFSHPEQFMKELISNALDASINGHQIGRFGMGFFSVFVLMLKGYATMIEVLTMVPKTGVVHKLTVTLVKGSLVGTLEVGNFNPLKHPTSNLAGGTQVRIVGKNAASLTTLLPRILEMIYHFRYYDRVSIKCNGKDINDRSAKPAVNIYCANSSIAVFDSGKGMDRDTLKTLLIPSVSTKGLKSQSSKMQVEVEVSPCEPSDGCVLHICVNRVVLKEIVVKDRDVGALMVIFLPENTHVPVGRDDVLLSDTQTFVYMCQAVEHLVNSCISKQNLIILETVINEYVSKSKQPKAPEILLRMRAMILDSDVILVPPNDVMIGFLAKKLKIRTVISNIFNQTKLERKFIDIARTKGIKIQELYGRLVISCPSISKSELRYLSSPHFCKLIVVKTGFEEVELKQLSFNASAGCLARGYNCDGSWARLVFAENESDEGDLSGERSQLLHEYAWLTPHLDLIYAVSASIEDYIVSRNKLYYNMLKDLVSLWQRRSLPKDRFEDQLVKMYTHFATHIDHANKYATADTKDLGKPAYLEPDCMTRFFKRPNPYPPMVFLDHILRGIELDLIEFKISVFQHNVYSHTSYPVFGLGVGFHTFEDLGFNFVQKGLGEDVILQLFTTITQHCQTVVEMFVDMLVFASLLDSSTPIDLSAISPKSTQMAMEIIIAEVRKLADGPTLNEFFENRLVYHTEDLHGNIFTPIEVIFPSIADLLTKGKTPFVGYLQNSQAVLQQIGFFEAAGIWTFSINDLIMFAYQNELEQDSFATSDLLHALEAFGKQNNGACPLQAIRIVSNFGTTKEPVSSIITELFQNSLDALRQNQLVDQSIQIGIDIGRIQMFDKVGIPTNKLLTLLIPFYSEKKQNEALSGEMGTGFFNVFRQPVCKQVIVTTNIEGGYPCRLTLTPVKSVDGEVIDIKVEYEISRSIKMRGTLVEVMMQPDQTLATHAFIECQSMFMGCLSDVSVNGELVSKNRELVYELDGFALYRVHSPRKTRSYVMANGVPFAPLSEYWYQINPFQELYRTISYQTQYFAMYPDLLTSTLQFNYVIDIDKSLYTTDQSRTVLVFKQLEWIRLRFLQSQTAVLVRLFSEADPFTQDLIEHTTDDADLSQIIPSVHCPTKKWADYNVVSWVPSSIKDLQTAISVFCTYLIKRAKRDPTSTETWKEFANRSLSTSQICDPAMGAIRNWFECKNSKINILQSRSSVPLSLGETTGVYKSDMLSEFVQVMWFRIMDLFRKGWTLQSSPSTNVVTQSGDVPMVYWGTKCPQDILAVYHQAENCIIVARSEDHSFASFTLLEKCKSVHADQDGKERLLSMFKENEGSYNLVRRLKRTSSTLMHEVLHALFKSVHDSGPHPQHCVFENKLISRTVTGSFDTVAMEIENQLETTDMWESFIARVHTANPTLIGEEVHIVC